MKISASLTNSLETNRIIVETEGNKKTISIANKVNGRGSAVNGGELLFLALATCFCNDLYREAARRNIPIDSIDVTVTGEFGAEGEPGKNINYKVIVNATGVDEKAVNELIEDVDKVAEIHNTLRRSAQVTLITKGNK